MFKAYGVTGLNRRTIEYLIDVFAHLNNVMMSVLICNHFIYVCFFFQSFRIIEIHSLVMQVKILLRSKMGVSEKYPI